MLFLECMNEPQVEVTGGGYADPRSRGEIESAAVEFVTRTLESEHFVIHDHQRENLGYDLLANKKSVTLYIEVKGTDSPEPRFFISRKERRFAHANADWRLFVVCETRRSPALFRYSCSEMEAEFAFDPLVWECKRGGG